MNQTTLSNRDLVALAEIVDSERTWFEVSRDPRLKWRMVSADTCCSGFWDWDGLSYNPNIDVSILLATPLCPWNWDTVSLNTCIPMCDIIRCKELPWNWTLITRERATWPMMYKHPQVPWDYAEFSCTKKLSKKVLIENPHLPWNYAHLSKTRMITIAFVSRPDVSVRPWDWAALTRNEQISVTSMLSHSSLPWDWEFLIAGRYVTLNQMFKYPHVPWEWSWIEPYLEEHQLHMTPREFYDRLDKRCREI
jgi:hypothetical protein